MKIFLQELVNEHDLILHFIKKIEEKLLNVPYWNREHWNSLENLILFIDVFIERYHHRKEEEILFPKIDLSPIVYQGGPYCTHFYHFHLMYQHYEQSLELLKEAGLPKEPPPTSERVKKIVENRSGLMVPLEEHWASHNVLRLLQHQIGLYKNLTKREQCQIDIIRKGLSFYSSLIHQHTEKENKCLFAMADNLLDHDTQVELSRQATQEISLDENFLLKLLQPLGLAWPI